MLPKRKTGYVIHKTFLVNSPSPSPGLLDPVLAPFSPDSSLDSPVASPLASAPKFLSPSSPKNDLIKFKIFLKLFLDFLEMVFCYQNCSDLQ